MKHSTNRNQTQFWVLKIKKKYMMMLEKKGWNFGS